MFEACSGKHDLDPRWTRLGIQSNKKSTIADFYRLFHINPNNARRWKAQWVAGDYSHTSKGPPMMIDDDLCLRIKERISNCRPRPTREQLVSWIVEARNETQRRRGKNIIEIAGCQCFLFQNVYT